MNHFNLVLKIYFRLSIFDVVNIALHIIINLSTSPELSLTILQIFDSSIAGAITIIIIKSYLC